MEVGKSYHTRGGWRAKVIWHTYGTNIWWAVHQPETEEESKPIMHYDDGTAHAISEIHEPPSYGLNPADIIEDADNA